ncbi:hypothetical protein DITRI_Ditri18aG0014500 [Diplodiscus trichospermus]
MGAKQAQRNAKKQARRCAGTPREGRMEMGKRKIGLGIIDTMEIDVEIKRMKEDTELGAAANNYQTAETGIQSRQEQ